MGSAGAEEEKIRRGGEGGIKREEIQWCDGKGRGL